MLTQQQLSLGQRSEPLSELGCVGYFTDKRKWYVILQTKEGDAKPWRRVVTSFIVLRWQHYDKKNLMLDLTMSSNHSRGIMQHCQALSAHLSPAGTRILPTISERLIMPPRPKGTSCHNKHEQWSACWGIWCLDLYCCPQVTVTGYASPSTITLTPPPPLYFSSAPLHESALLSTHTSAAVGPCAAAIAAVGAWDTSKWSTCLLRICGSNLSGSSLCSGYSFGSCLCSWQLMCNRAHTGPSKPQRGISFSLTSLHPC